MFVFSRFQRLGDVEMGSVRRLSAGEAPSKVDIAKAARLLADQHGKDADTVAAKRADRCFRNGNTAEGARWLEIFRSLAMRRSI